MLTIEQALQQMLVQLPFPQQQTTLPIQQAQNRICAQDVISPLNVPAFDNSAMDGYAVRLQDFALNTPLTVVGKSFAGKPFTGEWQAGTVIRIMTGAMLPAGADAVIMQEEAQVHSDGTVSFSQMPKPQQNIRYCGEDIKQGDTVLPKGTKLNTLSLPLLASLGITEIAVYPRLKVALFSSGDEIVSLGQPLQAGQIYDTNRFTVKLLLEQLNCEILDFGILPDDEQAFTSTFTQAAKEADLIISSGGVSVGEADFTKTVLEKVGEVNFWKIAMRPGKPFAFGKVGKAWFCGLPGNPVSALVTFYQLVQPAIAKLSGFSQWKAPIRLPAIAATKMKKSQGRLDFQRGFYAVNEAGKIEVKPVGFQGSHLFSALIQSNCFIRLEAERGNVEAGETVTIEPFNYLFS